MSQASVCAAVADKAGQIAGIMDSRVGRPDTVNWPDAPGVLVYADAPTDERQLSFGPNGVIQVTYTIHLDCVLGSQNLSESEADTQAQVLADGFRAAFWPDRTLGGACFDSTLSSAGDNLRNYRRDTFQAEDRYAGYPVVAWQLQVIEHVAASAAATD